MRLWIWMSVSLLTSTLTDSHSFTWYQPLWPWQTKHPPCPLSPRYLCGSFPSFLKSLLKCHILNEVTQSQQHSLCAPCSIFLHGAYNYQTYCTFSWSVSLIVFPLRMTAPQEQGFSLFCFTVVSPAPRKNLSWNIKGI